MDAALRELNDELTAVVERLAAEAGGDLRDEAVRLRSVYRSRDDRTAGLASALGGRREALAYAASRMSGTHAAALSVLAEAEAGLPTAPRSVVDLGGGTGAAAIAAAQLWPDCRVRVVDRSAAALELGRRIVAGLDDDLGGRIDWVRGDMADAGAEPVDLAILGYSLVEAADPASLAASVLDRADAVAVIEPGSREGYGNVLAVRARALAAGRSIVAPCPHDGACPLEGTRDWCHFGVRTTRTARQVRMKDGTRGFEDEKYSYVVVAREALERPGNRVIARPRFGGRLVHLTLCRATGEAAELTVPKSSPDYAAARRAGWGDGVDLSGRSSSTLG